MSINATQLVVHIIKPVFQFLEPEIPNTIAAVELVLGTAAQESHMGTYIKQMGSGPACGIYQMEPATHKDIWQNFIRYKPKLLEKLEQLNMPWEVQSRDAQETGFPDAVEMIGNLYYATAMCRVHYFRVKESLPAAGDIVGQARYWKKYYNTELGAGTEHEYLENWKKFVNGGR